MNRNMTTRILTIIIFMFCSVSAMRMATNFWVISWGEAGGADPFVKTYKNVSGDNPWRPEFIAEMSPYTAYRFMDWGKTNGSDDILWSNRTMKSSLVQNPVAYEWMIDLCNRTKKDMWVCVPHKANEDYRQNLAKLIFETLDPSLKCYVEYSNETWNTAPAFPQSGYTVTQGKSLGLIGGTDQEKGWSYTVYAAIRIFETFESVFGKNSPRLVKVLAGWSNQERCTIHHMKCLDDPKINPNKTLPSVYSVTGYMGGTTISDLRNFLYQEKIPKVKLHIQIISAKKLPLVFYEGGQHANSSDAREAVSADPQIYSLYLDLFNEMAKLVDSSAIFCHYVHSGSTWGAKISIGDPLAKAHKYRAIVDWATKNHPASSVNNNWGRIQPLNTENMSVLPVRNSYYIDLSGKLVKVTEHSSAKKIFVMPGQYQVLPALHRPK